MAAILITAGASGGHIFPALRSAVVLAQHGLRIICVWPHEAGRRFLTSQAMRDLVMPLTQKNKIVLLKAPPSVLQSVVHAASVMRRYSPRMAIGFGGRHTLPYLFMAKGRRAVVLVHEQNVRMGRANRLMGWMADAVMTSFPQKQPNPSTQTMGGRCVIHVGLPTLWAPKKGACASDAMQKACVRRRLGLDPQDKTLLLIGGSQGSHALSEAVWAALARRCLDREPYQLIHLCGVRQDERYWVKKWQQIGLRAHVTAFMVEMEEIYQSVDAAVTRAGANVLTELALFKVPSVIVPYPGAGGHQWDNARYFERLEWGCLWSQESGDANALLSLLERLLSRPRESFGVPLADALLDRPETERRLIQTVTRFLN